MQALGLDVRVLDKYNEEIDLKQTFNDDDMGLVSPDVPAIATDTDFEGNYDGYTIEDNEGNPVTDESEDDGYTDSYGDDEE